MTALASFRADKPRLEGEMAASAGFLTSVILGVNFTMQGMREYCLTQRVTISIYSGT